MPLFQFASLTGGRQVLSSNVPGIGWQKSFAFGFAEIEIPQSVDYLASGELAVEPLLKKPVQQQCQEACGKVRLYPIVAAEVHRSGLELALHYPKALLNLPPAVVNVDDDVWIVFEVGAYRMQAACRRRP